MPAKKIVKKTKKKVEVAPAPAYKPVEEEKVKPEEEGKNDKREQSNILAHQRGLAKGKLTKMLNNLSGEAMLSVAMLKAYQKKLTLRTTSSTRPTSRSCRLCRLP